MGNYVNPTDGRTKEKWLAEEGFKVSRKRFSRVAKFEFDFYDGASMNDGVPSWFVVLADHGPFTAGIICYSENEFDYVKRSLADDQRPLTFYIVAKVKLEQFLEVE